ncbi:glycoside hydrolase family 25 protein [Streptomyces malaysiense]|nr:GH25 family lysozyme [Streptomyces malaysiense]
MIHGIDVSAYQPSTYSTSGLDFVIVKATEGTSYINPRMQAQADHARAAGLVVGFYHFLRPGSMTAQAAYFVSKCASRPGDILAADWEDQGVSCADKDTFLREVKRLRPNHKVILYCNQTFWLGRDTTSYAGDGLWIADYVTAGKPRIKAKWLIHQYTDAAPQGGDGDVAAFDSRAALAAWAAGTTPQEADMQLSDQINIGAWIPAHWPDDKGLADRKIPVDLALGSGYAHSRIAHENSDKIVAMLTKMQAQEAAQTAAIEKLASLIGSGVDTATVVAAVQKAIADAVVHVSVDVTGSQG